MNLYFFGGAFDPPHLAHKKIINYFVNKYEFLVIVPSYRSPFKKEFPLASFYHRKKMIELILEKDNQGKTSIIEYENISKSNYTYKTIKFIKTKYKEYKIHMIIGADQYEKIHLWKNSKYIINNVNLIVISRPGISITNKKSIYKYINEISIEISSSEIRKNINKASFMKNKLDIDVYNYIKENKLYQ